MQPELRRASLSCITGPCLKFISLHFLLSTPIIGSGQVTLIHFQSILYHSFYQSLTVDICIYITFPFVSVSPTDESGDKRDSDVK